jgi:hypothetical protein
VAEDWSDCALKPRCTRVERRFVRRHFYQDALERMNARVEADPSLMGGGDAPPSTHLELSNE